MAGILFLFHVAAGTGYAIGRHERTFAKVGRSLFGSLDRVHYGYPKIPERGVKTIEGLGVKALQFDAGSESAQEQERVLDYVRQNGIEIAIGFDQPVGRRLYKGLRSAGIRTLVSYWGAPISSENSGLKLLAKKIEVFLTPHKPDHFVFQSDGMQRFATHGRGIPRRMTSIIRSGVDTDVFRPGEAGDYYAHDALGIPRERKIVFFSGHMEPRKGVDIIVKSAVELVHRRQRRDVHFLLLGNYPGQEEEFRPIFQGTRAEPFITFGGYRPDIPEILRSCHIGMIASTGWDSFPMSGIEMAAAGLPVVISDLVGLREVITDDTGLKFPVGDPVEAANCVERLLEDEPLRQGMGMHGRARAVSDFSVDRQARDLEALLRRLHGI